MSFWVTRKKQKKAGPEAFSYRRPHSASPPVPPAPPAPPPPPRPAPHFLSASLRWTLNGWLEGGGGVVHQRRQLMLVGNLTSCGHLWAVNRVCIILLHVCFWTIFHSIVLNLLFTVSRLLFYLVVVSPLSLSQFGWDDVWVFKVFKWLEGDLITAIASSPFSSPFKESTPPLQ